MHNPASPPPRAAPLRVEDYVGKPEQPRNELVPLIAIAFLLNSALYLIGCFIVGYLTGNAWAWKLALAASGVTVLCYQAQLPPVQPRDRIVAATWSALSIGLGTLAGLALLVRT